MKGEAFSAESRRKITFLALSFFFVFGFSNVSYFLPVYYEQIGMKSKDAGGWLVAAFYVMSVISRPFLANAVESFGFRRIFLVAGILSILSSVGVALSGSYFWPGIASRAFLGIASSLFLIGLATYQAVAFKEEERGRAFSLIMAGGLAPMMTLVPFADWLLLHQRNGVYILLPLLICVAAAAVTLSIPGIDAPIARKKSGTGGQKLLAGLSDCLKIPYFRLALLSVFFFSIADAAAAFMAPMTRHYGLMASLFLSANAVTGVLVRVLCGKLLDRIPRNKLAPAAVILTAGTLFLATVSPTQQSLILLGLAFGVGMGLGFPLHLALVSDYVPDELQPQAVSLCWFLMGLNFAVVPLAMGWLGDFIGPVAIFRIITGLAILGAILEYPALIRISSGATARHH